MTQKNVLKVLIVDDEPSSVLLLRSLLEEIPNVEIAGEANQAEKAFFMILERLPDLVFLDINMPGHSGTDLKNLLNKRMIDVPVVFVSANKEFAIDAIRNGVYDFLHKPVIKSDLIEIVEKYRSENRKLFHGKLVDIVNSIPEEIKIRINSQHSYILVNPLDIVYCRSFEGYTNIYLANGKKELASANLSQMEVMVERWNFYRLGRSLLINLDYIRKIDKTENKCYLKSSNGKWKVSSSQQAIKELLTSYYSYAQY